VPSMQPAPGGARKPVKDKTSRSVGDFLSNGWWGGIAAIAGVLAVGGAVAAVIAILPSDQHAAQGTSVAAIRFSDLSRITVARYGLIFSYPSDWDLQYTPEDQDGAEFLNPEDSAVSITGYGTPGDLLPRYPTIVDVQKEWHQLILSRKDPRIIEAAASGTFVQDGPAEYPVDGWRVVFQYVNDHGQSMTDMVKAVFANGREVDLVMEAPTREFPSYKQAFLQLSDKLLLLTQCQMCSG
jgi:hypothetical protein